MKPAIYFCAFAIFTFIFSTASFSQEKYRKNNFCEDGDYWGNKVSFNELRETTISSGKLVEVDARKNGGIQVRGENRNDVLVRACVRTWGKTDDEAKDTAKNIRVETGSVIRAESPNDENNWSVSYEILVPRRTDLQLSAQNGGIVISSVEGSLNFETRNGGIVLKDLAGDVKGRTTNGGIVLSLSGSAWKGAGLDVQTTNGGIVATVPENFAGRFDVGTTNGGFRSSISELSVEKPSEKNGWNRRTKVSADVNGGGAPIRFVTTNGGIVIKSSDNEK